MSDAPDAAPVVADSSANTASNGDHRGTRHSSRDRDDRRSSHRSSRRSSRDGDDRRRRRRSYSRSRSTSRSPRRRRRSHRRSRSRSGSRRRHRSHRRSRRRSTSSSRSRSPPRRRKKSSNFDVGPGMGGGNAPGAGSGPPGMPGMMPGMMGGPGMFPMMGGGGQMMPGMGMAPPMASNQQTRHARRLYVGGCGETAEEEMMRFFTDAITKVVKVPLSGPPVLSVYVNRERKFSFVEFSSIELATAGLNLDGIMYRGTALRVRRPNDYRPDLVPPPMGPPIQVDLSAVQMGGGMGGGGGSGGPPTNVKDRIFIGGIPYTMTEPQVRELFTAFGPLKDLQLIQDNGMPKGYGFCEYADPSVTDKAIEALNGIRIGDRELTVRRANPPGTGRQTQAQAAGAPMGMGMGMGMMNPMMMNPMMMNPMMMQQQMMGAAGPSGPPTRVVMLKNMVSESELADPQEYSDIKEDVEEECKKFGTVTSVAIPKPGEVGCGKVFVQFSDAQGSQTAAAALNNRKFGDNTVVTEYFDEAKFTSGNFQ